MIRGTEKDKNDEFRDEAVHTPSTGSDRPTPVGGGRTGATRTKTGSGETEPIAPDGP
jgi:hypothetical protein